MVARSRRVWRARVLLMHGRRSRVVSAVQGRALTTLGTRTRRRLVRSRSIRRSRRLLLRRRRLITGSIERGVGKKSIYMMRTSESTDESSISMVVGQSDLEKSTPTLDLNMRGVVIKKV